MTNRRFALRCLQITTTAGTLTIAATIAFIIWDQNQHGPKCG